MLKLSLDRLKRRGIADRTLPRLCYALYYHVKEGETCDCVNVCKYPYPYKPKESDDKAQDKQNS